MMTNGPLPEWLAREERYAPARDKDAFINRSILSVLSVLSKIRSQGSRRQSKQSAHAFFKMSLALVIIVLLSFSRSYAFVLAVGVGLLCRLCLMKAEDIAKILRNSLIAAAFAAVILLPAGLLGDWYGMAMITSKVFASVTAVGLLSHSAGWNEMTGAMKSFFIPDIFIFVLDIAIKYILLLGEYALNMLYALKLRSIGKNNVKRASLSGIAGTMFLHSREMAGEMHAAMECRGFSGEYKRPVKFRVNAMDAATVTVAVATIALFFYLGR